MIDRLRANAPDDLVIADDVGELLARCYGGASRHYHDLTHVVEVAERFAEVAGAVGWRAPREVYVAVLFHDAVYDPARRDNEAASAALARRHWTGGEVDLDRATELIELTAAHGSLTADAVDPDAALFLDCDMAVLGADTGRFADYDAAVAREYRAVVPADAYARGREQFLTAVLAKPRLFLSPYFHDRLDGAARCNLACAVAALRFDSGRFWDAHEAWEIAWLRAADGPEKHALQGLIQCAAALLQVDRGHRDGAARILSRAVGHFGNAGGSYRGIDLERLSREVRARVDGSCQDPLTLRVEPP